MYNITLSAFKKTEILPFVTMWMKLQGIVSSEMSKREILSDSTSMKSIKQSKYMANSQWFPRGRGREWDGRVPQSWPSEHATSLANHELSIGYPTQSRPVRFIMCINSFQKRMQALIFTFLRTSGVIIFICLISFQLFSSAIQSIEPYLIQVYAFSGLAYLLHFLVF